MAQQTSISTLPESRECVVFDNFTEYISDIPDLISLTLVSKRVRSHIYRSNGLREVHLACDLESLELVLNGIVTTGENRKEKLKEGLRWLWSIGKRLKTVILATYYGVSTWDVYDSVLPLLKSLTATDKRRIQNIQIRGIPCEWAIDLDFLVKENRNTLRCLRVELWDQQYVSSLRSSQLSREQCSLSELSESLNFWSVVQQCERLRSLDLCLNAPESIRTELWNVLRETPLKHLSLSTAVGCLVYSEVYEKLVEVMSCDNLRNNLESLTLDRFILHLFIGGLPYEGINPHLSAALLNVKKLTFDFVAVCCHRNRWLVNWSVLWAIFPGLIYIQDNCSYRYISKPDCTILSYNVHSFCKASLDASGSSSREIKMAIGPINCSYSQKLVAYVAKAATLPEDQDWCVSHDVQIETKTRDEKIERVTLRKDAVTLVFDFNYD